MAELMLLEYKENAQRNRPYCALAYCNIALH